MEEFNTLEKVNELFKGVGCECEENCYFIALKNAVKAQSGVVGGMNYPYDGLLINSTNDGLGIFYLNYNKLTFKTDISKLVLNKKSYFFVPNDRIKSIKVKKGGLFNNKIKSITIKTCDKKTHQLLADLDYPLIPYHKDNFSKFIEKYQK